jgi:hypothetical protein
MTDTPKKLLCEASKMQTNNLPSDDVVEDILAASLEAYGAPPAEHQDPYFNDFMLAFVRIRNRRFAASTDIPESVIDGAFSRFYQSYPPGAELSVGDMLSGNGEDCKIGFKAGVEWLLQHERQIMTVPCEFARKNAAGQTVLINDDDDFDILFKAWESGELPSDFVPLFKTARLPKVAPPADTVLDVRRYQHLRNGTSNLIVGEKICTGEVETELSGEALDVAVDASIMSVNSSNIAMKKKPQGYDEVHCTAHVDYDPSTRKPTTRNEQ